MEPAAELAKSGGKGGRPLAVPTVQHVHRSLRKALNDAVMIDAVMSTNPTLKAKLPREGYREPRVVWTPEDLEIFLQEAASHRLHAFFRPPGRSSSRRFAMAALLIGYSRCSTDQQDLTAQRDGLAALGWPSTVFTLITV